MFSFNKGAQILGFDFVPVGDFNASYPAYKAAFVEAPIAFQKVKKKKKKKIVFPVNISEPSKHFVIVFQCFTKENPYTIRVKLSGYGQYTMFKNLSSEQTLAKLQLLEEKNQRGQLLSFVQQQGTKITKPKIQPRPPFDRAP